MITIKTLQDLLDESDITQKEVAFDLGISESYCSLLVNGKRKMSFDIAIYLSSKINRPLDDIWSAYNVCRKSTIHPKAS